MILLWRSILEYELNILHYMHFLLVDHMYFGECWMPARLQSNVTSYPFLTNLTLLSTFSSTLLYLQLLIFVQFHCCLHQFLQFSVQFAPSPYLESTSEITPKPSLPPIMYSSSYSIMASRSGLNSFQQGRVRNARTGNARETG